MAKLFRFRLPATHLRTLRAIVMGQTEHGVKSEGPFDRVKGTGWVRQECGQYSDAISKGHPVVLLGMESTGALFHTFALFLQMLGRQSTAPGTHDSTVYGGAHAEAARVLLYRGERGGHHAATRVQASWRGRQAREECWYDNVVQDGALPALHGVRSPGSWDASANDK